MELKLAEWTALLCICAFGIKSSMAWVQSMREIEQNCFRDGGYCINTIPPPPPRRRNNNRRRPGAARGTRTRTGARPDPRAVASTHTRLPGSSQPSGGVAPPPAGRAPAYTPAQPAHSPAAYDPAGGPSAQPPAAQQNNFAGLFGNNPNDPFGGMLGMMMFTRKKRQAGVPEPHERPRRRRGEGLYPFLNQHCRKSEFDFGCRREGGMCCLPFLK